MATITYTYQWQISTDGGATWSDIAGATSTSYTPPAGSAGKQARAIVTATNGDGSAQATSPASAVILLNPPVNTVAPALSGTAQDGNVLTAAKGTWTGMATITYAYQWQVSTDGGATWSDIAGATATTYTLPAGFAGNQVRVLVTGTNGDGTSPAPAAATASILANPPANTSAPTLSGTAQDGNVLTAANGTWTGMATITYAYQWQVSTDGGATWGDIAAATATTYTLPAGFAGNEVRVLVTGTNGDGASTAPSAATASILASPPVNTLAPAISGTSQDAQPLTATTGTWTGVGTITYAYQWQVSADGGATWSDIAGATGSTYTPPLGSAGKQVRVTVTATNGDGSTQAPSGSSAALQPSPPVNTKAPAVSGVAADGQVLATDVGSWTGPGTITFAFQWQISSDGGATWTDVAGATASTYALSGRAGKQVRVLVSATNADGSTPAASAASATIVAQPPPAATPPAAPPAQPAAPKPEPGVEVQSTPPPLPTSTPPRLRPSVKNAKSKQIETTKKTQKKKKKAKSSKKKRAPNPWRRVPG
jgi:hypothetical protein